jgi:hypothetical protein
MSSSHFTTIFDGFDECVFNLRKILASFTNRSSPFTRNTSTQHPICDNFKPTGQLFVRGFTRLNAFAWYMIFVVAVPGRPSGFPFPFRLNRSQSLTPLASTRTDILACIASLTAVNGNARFKPISANVSKNSVTMLFEYGDTKRPVERHSSNFLRNFASDK